MRNDDRVRLLNSWINGWSFNLNSLREDETLRIASICRLQLQLFLLLLLVVPISGCDEVADIGGSMFLGNASQLNSDLWPFESLSGITDQNVYSTGNGFFGNLEEGMPSHSQSEKPSRKANDRTLTSGTREHKDGSSECFERKEALRVISEVANEYIVRFNEYRYSSAHRQALQQTLRVKGWTWIERNNPAASFPTDFGLLRIQNDQRDLVLRHLGGLSFVRDVSPQMQFTRSLTVDSKGTYSVSDGEATRPEGLKFSGVKGGADRRRMSHQYPATSTKSGLVENSEDSNLEMKPPGRLRSSMSFEDDVLQKQELGIINASVVNHRRDILGMERSQITSMFDAEQLWARGFTGSKVRMAVFDTGVRADHPHFRNIKERTNWTNEKDILNDNLGHGTFVAGVISSQDPECLGFAPDAEIYAFRVFTDAQVSYTSWFLDAFNYAIATKMNVLNLSIGGPDYLDTPFVEKVWEMTANNIIMVSAIGNDGPLYGTLNNPADQSDVIGVGGIDYTDHIASFSSRGMSTWELPHGYGRVKPDIVAYGREVIGSRITTGCKSLSGTSVASPVVAGAVCLLASVVPEDHRWDILNPASMKQALIEGAAQLIGPNIYEQGAGRLDLSKSFEILLNYTARASIHPSVLDLTDCPYMWPFCRQPLYHGAMPLIFNATILNGMGVVGYVESPPIWTPSGSKGNFLDIQYLYSDVIWPWTGYMGLHFRIKPEGSKFSGNIEGNISFTVVSPPGKGEDKPRTWDCYLPVKVAVIPTPVREKRILWDQFHSIQYPPGYIPRDSLDVRNDILDWHGDHMHTNFHGMFDSLRDAGYFLESLGSPLTCFDANQYGTLLMVDLEDEYFTEEIEKLKDDVENLGLGLIVYADWYHLDTIVKMRFFDDNTRSWWTPATGGANIPALNNLLAPFGIAFGDTILTGAFSIGGERAHYASGTDIQRFPAGGFVHRFLFQDTSGGNTGITSTRTGVRAQVESPILGMVEAGLGRIAVYGDSNCLDSSHMVTNCYWLLKKLLDFTSYKIRDPLIFPSSNELTDPLGSPDSILPVRGFDVNFSAYSLVLGHPLQCGIDAPIVVQGLKGFLAQSEKFRSHIYTDITPGSNSGTQRQSMTSDDKDILGPLVGSFLEINGSKVGRETGSQLSTSYGGSNDASDNLVQIDGFLNSTSEENVLAKDFRINSGEVVQDNSVGKETSFMQQSNEISDDVGRIKTKKGAGLTVGFQRKEEPDNSGLVFPWLFPGTLCATGFFLIWSLWRVRQRRPRRVKKGSKFSPLTF